MDSTRVAFRFRCCQASLVLPRPPDFGGGWPDLWATLAGIARQMGWSHSPEGLWRVCPDCAEAAREAVRDEQGS